MTDASAGLTRCSICFKTEACNLRTCPLKPSTDALLADLRGKLEEQADAYRQNIEAMRSTRDGIQRELMSVTTQLEAERAKVREMEGRSMNQGMCIERLENLMRRAAHADSLNEIAAYVLCIDTPKQALPASVDAKGEKDFG
jgi:hypothetical protein